MTSRRGFLLAAASLAVGWPGAALPQSSDRGIGGTGVVPTGPVGEDRGIGGTGVVGTIRRFGSIYVNGLRITYPKDVAVFVDGERRGTDALRLGQVAQVVARPIGKRLVTDRIDIHSEVVGRVESRAGRMAVVAGQAVRLPAAASGLAIGESVAVSGMRRTSGVIEASLVEARPAASTLVAGPVRQRADGSFTIGNLRLNGLDPSLAGTRAIVTGPVGDDGLAVASARRDRGPIGPGIQRVSIEAFAARVDRRVILGSGYEVSGSARSIPSRGAGMVLTGRPDQSGRLQLDSARAVRQGDGPVGGARGGGPSSDGRGPTGPTGPSHSGPGGGGRSDRDLRRPQDGPGGGPMRGPGPGGFGGPGGPGGFGGPGGGGGPGGIGGPGGGPGGGFGGPGGGFGGPRGGR